MSKYQFIAGGVAMVVSVAALIVAKIADNKSSEVEERVNTAVHGLSGITGDVLDSRVSDGLISESIREAADRKVRSITRNTADEIKKTVEARAQSIVDEQYKKVMSELNIKGMVKAKAKHIVRNLTAYDISKTLEDDIKDAVIHELKDSIRQKLANNLI